MKYSIVLYFVLMLSFMSCSDELIFMDDKSSSIQVFEEFWTYVDEHYIYFDVKEVDWSEVRKKYIREIHDGMTEEELYKLCNRALGELKDSHNRIETPDLYERSYDIREGYDIQFSFDVVKEHYITDTIQRDGYVFSTILKDEIGYIYLPAMSRYGALTKTIRQMKSDGVKGLIIDVRNNGGGDSNPLPEIFGDFVQEETVLGYYLEKSGPAHGDVTEPLVSKAIPSGDFFFDLPVSLITNRGSYSATSYLAGMIKQIPKAVVVGQKTGGGGGGNYGYQLSNGWIVAVSVSDFLTPDMKSIEQGVDPDIKVENTKEQLENGVDDMLQTAINVILDYN